MYATYMSVLGNREDLFGDSPYVDKYITNPPADYDVNPEYLNDEKFATLITEAEKYLGYPYVWGAIYRLPVNAQPGIFIRQTVRKSSFRRH